MSHPPYKDMKIHAPDNNPNVYIFVLFQGKIQNCFVQNVQSKLLHPIYVCYDKIDEFYIV